MVLQYDSYKLYLRDWMDRQEAGGRGQIMRMAEFLNVSASLISTILNSDRHFSIEQACEVAEYLKLGGVQAEYFIALVALEKAGSEKLKKYWLAQKKKILKESENIKTRIKYEKTLSQEQQTQYYSSSLYSQIRVLSTLEKGISVSELETVIKISRSKIDEAVQFLIDAGLIVAKNDRYFASEQMIHINKESVHHLHHHMNWRLQQLQQVTSIENDDLTFTFPCTLNEKDFVRVKEILTKAISDSHKVIKASPAEEMACLTIDFISYARKS